MVRNITEVQIEFKIDEFFAKFKTIIVFDIYNINNNVVQRFRKDLEGYGFGIIKEKNVSLGYFGSF